MPQHVFIPLLCIRYNILDRVSMIKAFAYCFPGVLLPLFQADQHLRTFFKTSLTIFPCCGIVVKSTTWARSSAGSASVSLLCPTELWAFKWGVCRLVAQPSHAPKYGPIAQLGERSVRIREVKGSNPSRSTNLPHRFVRCGVFYV